MTDTLVHLLGHPIDRDDPLILPETFCLERGVFGGLVMAVAVDAIKAKSVLPVRTLQMNLCALALPGVPTQVSVIQKRTGKHTESLQFELVQADTVVAHGTGFCGHRRHTQRDEVNLASPALPSPDTVTPVPDKGLLPPYTQHIEIKPCWGEQLFSKGRLESGGWVALRKPSPLIDEVVVSTLIDSWWPANLIRGMRPMATVSIQISFLDLEDLPRDRPLALTTQTQAVYHGYATELDQLWTESGRLVASAQQVIAVIK